MDMLAPKIRQIEGCLNSFKFHIDLEARILNTIHKNNNAYFSFREGFKKLQVWFMTIDEWGL